MNRLDAILAIRNKLQNGSYSVGSWMQIPHPSIAEIMGQAGYDWVAIDMEHGAISPHQLPDLFRALELGETLPLVRLAYGHQKDCKKALDAGAGGVIIPMIESAEQLNQIVDVCRWPPAGKRGVGLSRANLFGKFFQGYVREAQQPLIIAMIENHDGVNNLDDILKVKGLDAILIGPYDLSASMGITAQFDHLDFRNVLKNIKKKSDLASVPCGVHVVDPSETDLKERIAEGYRFIAYAIDSTILISSSNNPTV
jgi:2-dehydro-3-deoxyglucarate aldolase